MGGGIRSYHYLHYLHKDLFVFTRSILAAPVKIYQCTKYRFLPFVSWNRESLHSGPNKKKSQKLLPLLTGTWNVRFIQTSLNYMDMSHGLIRKMAVTDRELSRQDPEIAVQQETRWGHLSKKKIVLFFLERPKYQQAQTFCHWHCYPK